MNTFGERLAYFIALVGMRPAEFSREVGYKRPDKIYHAIDNKFKLSLESLEDIANRFPELNLDWLVRGEGEPLKPIRIETDSLPQKLKDKVEALQKYVLTQRVLLEELGIQIEEIFRLVGK